MNYFQNTKGQPEGKKGLNLASLLRVTQIVALVTIVLVLAFKGFQNAPQQGKVTDFRLTCQNATASDLECWSDILPTLKYGVSNDRAC